MRSLIGVFVLLIVCFLFLLQGSTKEGYEDALDDADYTQRYTKQIEDYLKVELAIKVEVEGMVDKSFITWPINVDKTSIAKQMEALPLPDAYVEALKKQSDTVDAKLLENDINEESISKINSFTSLEELGVPIDSQKLVADKKTELKAVIEAIKLPSLSKFKERSIQIEKKFDEIYVLIFRIAAKVRMQPKEPDTVEKFIEYEINKFAKPVWQPLQFVLGRLAKLTSLGADGTAKYNDNEAMGLAIKDLSEKSKVTDIDKFYLLMSGSKGEPPFGTETLEKLFNDTLSYLNLVLYMGGKMKELSGKTGAAGEGFFGGFGLLESWEGWEDMKKAKCIPCQIEPEVHDIDGLKKRYAILKSSRKQFKAEVEKLMEGQKKIEEIEKKALSGELMTEMIADKKIE